MKFTKTASLLAISAALTACSQSPDLPEHTVDISSLAPRTGERVQVDVTEDITREECKALIDAYRGKGAPDGQITAYISRAQC